MLNDVLITVTFWTKVKAISVSGNFLQKQYFLLFGHCLTWRGCQTIKQNYARCVNWTIPLKDAPH